MRYPLAITFLSLVLLGCEAPVQHTGKRPLGRRRPISEAGEPVSGQTAGEPTRPATGEDVDVAAQRVGVAESMIFHRPDCPLLEGVGRGSRILFVSAYDALDGGCAPCQACSPLR